MGSEIERMQQFWQNIEDLKQQYQGIDRRELTLPFCNEFLKDRKIDAIVLLYILILSRYSSDGWLSKIEVVDALADGGYCKKNAAYNKINYIIDRSDIYNSLGRKWKTKVVKPETGKSLDYFLPIIGYIDGNGRFSSTGYYSINMIAASQLLLLEDSLAVKVYAYILRKNYSFRLERLKGKDDYVVFKKRTVTIGGKYGLAKIVGYKDVAAVNSRLDKLAESQLVAITKNQVGNDMKGRYSIVNAIYSNNNDDRDWVSFHQAYYPNDVIRRLISFDNFQQYVEKDGNIVDNNGEIVGKLDIITKAKEDLDIEDIEDIFMEEDITMEEKVDTIINCSDTSAADNDNSSDGDDGASYGEDETPLAANLVPPIGDSVDYGADYGADYSAVAQDLVTPGSAACYNFVTSGQESIIFPEQKFPSPADNSSETNHFGRLLAESGKDISTSSFVVTEPIDNFSDSFSDDSDGSEVVVEENVESAVNGDGDDNNDSDTKVETTVQEVESSSRSRNEVEYYLASNQEFIAECKKYSRLEKDILFENKICERLAIAKLLGYLVENCSDDSKAEHYQEIRRGSLETMEQWRKEGAEVGVLKYFTRKYVDGDINNIPEEQLKKYSLELDIPFSDFFRRIVIYFSSSGSDVEVEWLNSFREKYYGSYNNIGEEGWKDIAEKINKEILGKTTKKNSYFGGPPGSGFWL